MHWRSCFTPTSISSRQAGDFRGIVGPSAAGVYMRSDLDEAVEMAAPAPQSPGAAGRGRPAVHRRAMTEEVLERALAAERAAESELAQIPSWIWDGERLPVPIETVADTHYGLLVREHDDLCELIGIADEGHVSGLLMPATREIWINAGEAARAPNRRRFTIGHELGHWVLHCDRGSRDDHTLHCRESTLREEGAVVERDGSTHLADLA